MLFQVEGTVVFLAGSVHRGKAHYYPLPKPVELAFLQSEEVWFESPPVADLPMRRCPEGSTLRDYVSIFTYYGLRLAYRRHFDHFKALKPWALASEFNRRAYATEGYSLEHGVERYLATKASEEKKLVHYLERPEDGVAAFDSAPAREQEMMLIHSAFRLNTVRREARECLAAWRNADLGASNRCVDKAIRLFPCFARLLYDRNQAWAPVLKEIVDRRARAFICVGFLHFAGTKSLQYYLKSEFGLDVRQIQTAKISE